MSLVKKIKFEQEIIVIDDDDVVPCITPEEVALACLKGDVDFLKKLKSEGYLFASQKDLYFAGCKGGSVEVVKFLRENVAYDKSVQEIFPLSVAAEFGHLKLVRFIFDEGFDKSRWAIFRAIEAGQHRIVKFLIRRGVDVNFGLPEPPLSIAASENQLEIAKLLLDKGADPNGIDDNERTPLFYAFQRDHVDMMILLLEHGADPNFVDIFGSGIFHQVQTSKEAKFFLKAGGNPDIVDINGRTPLQMAVRAGNFSLVKFFISWGLCSRQKDEEGESALSLAMRLFAEDLEDASDIFSFLLCLKDDKPQLSYLWKSIDYNREKLIPVLLENWIPFPKDFDSEIVKPIFTELFNKQWSRFFV